MRECGIAMECCKENASANVGCEQSASCFFAKAREEKVSQSLTFCSGENTGCGLAAQEEKEYRTVLANAERERLGYGTTQKQPRQMSRRNERERQRVRMVNLGFANLRNLVPDGRANKKMSKVETLRSAMEYIRQLKELVEEHDAVTAVFSSAFPRGSVPLAPPSYSYESDGSSNPMSPEDEELLDFSTWF